MAKEYVAYGELGGYKPGDVVNPTDWDRETWNYMVEHEVVVPKNSPNDPNVLEEQASENEGDETTQAERQRTAADEAYDAAAGSSTETKSTDESKSDGDATTKQTKPATPSQPTSSTAKSTTTPPKE